MLRLPRGLAAATAAGVCAALAGVGCDAIVGIQDGQLVTVDSGAVADGTAEGSVDSGGGMDGLAGDAGGMDSTIASDSTTPVDASDAGPPPSVRCTVNPGSKTLVADLSAFADGGGGCCGNPAQFQQILWAVPLTNDNNGVEIIAQNAADQTDFSIYQVNFGQTNFNPIVAGASSMGGVRLLDVEPSASGPVAMTTVGTGSNTQALQVVTLPSTNGGSPGSPTTISPTVLNNQYPNNAALLPTGTNGYDWLLSANGSGVTEMLSGNNADMQVTLVPSTPQSAHFGFAPLDLDSNLYAFVMGLGDAGNGTTVFAYPDNFSSSGTQSPLVSSSALSAIVEAHVSTIDSTKAALLGATIDQSGAGSAQLWSARLPASSLTSLTLGTPQFTAGTNLALSELPFNQGSTVPYGDQVFITGTGQGDQTTLLLVWVDANGVALSRPAVAGPLLSTGNVVRIATIAVGQMLSQYEVGLFLAWVEENGSGSSEYDQLWAAQVTCQPFAGD
jgi:hypothetical protein